MERKLRRGWEIRVGDHVFEEKAYFHPMRRGFSDQSGMVVELKQGWWRMMKYLLLS